jgi:hypothetical protein
MLMLLERLTGEVSVVAVCALAAVLAATTRIAAATAAMAALAQAWRRFGARRFRHDLVEASSTASSSFR